MDKNPSNRIDRYGPRPSTKLRGCIPPNLEEDAVDLIAQIARDIRHIKNNVTPNLFNRKPLIEDLAPIMEGHEGFCIIEEELILGITRDLGILSVELSESNVSISSIQQAVEEIQRQLLGARIGARKILLIDK